MQGISCTPMPTCQGGWAGGRPYHFPLLKGEPQAKTMRNSVMQQMQKGGGGRDWDFHTPVLCLPHFRLMFTSSVGCCCSPCFVCFRLHSHQSACPPALSPRRVGLGVEENPKHGACAGYSPFLLLLFLRGASLSTLFSCFFKRAVCTPSIGTVLLSFLLARRLYEDGLQRLQRLEDSKYCHAILSSFN